MAITVLPSPVPQRSDPTNFNPRADAFLTALPTFCTEANALQTDVSDKQATASAAATTATTQASNASTSASSASTSASTATTKASEASASAAAALVSQNAAAASAASAAAIAGAFVGTSTTSLTIGAGTKTFTTQAGEQYTAGVFMTAVSAANNANYMFGQVVSYSGTSLVLSVSMTGGSGTYADWNLSLAGPQGATGPQGIPGTGITPQTVGWTGTGGTTAKTLTVDVDLTASAVLLKAGGTLTGAVNSTEVDKGTVTSGTSTFAQSAGSVQRIQVGGTLTIATSSWPTSGVFADLLIKIVNGGAYVVTLPTINYIKPDGTLTTSLSTYMTAVGRTGLQASGTDFLYLFSDDAGTTIYGKLL